MNSFLDAQLAILVTSDPTLKTALLSSTNLNLSGKQKTLLESSISAANAGPEKALLLYSCGKYEASLKELHGVSGESACWGRLSSHILLKDWSAAHVDLFQLEEHFKHITDQKELLNKRGWWINWSLFVLCRDSKVDLVLDVYQCWINVIQTTCPWVMRYLAIFKLVKKKALTLPQFKETAQMLAMEERLYQDAFTRLASLSESLDFERASKDLIAADALFESDYFLASNPALRQSFMEAARLYVFELYSRIHQSVSFTASSSILGLAKGQTQKWVMNAISVLGIEATVAGDEVVFVVKRTNVHHLVMEKLNARSDALLKTVV